VCDPDPIYLNVSEETSYIVGIEAAVVVGAASRTPRLDQCLAGAEQRAEEMS